MLREMTKDAENISKKKKKITKVASEWLDHSHPQLTFVLKQQITECQPCVLTFAEEKPWNFKKYVIEILDKFYGKSILLENFQL